MNEYTLNPQDYGFGDWLAGFEASDAYEEGDKLLGLDAYTDRWGCALITATIERDGEELTLNPYFNQSGFDGDIDENGNDMSDGAQIEQDAREFLKFMAGATDWSEWDWPALNHFV